MFNCEKNILKQKYSKSTKTFKWNNNPHCPYYIPNKCKNL